jgi:hypothetical protein
MFLRSPDLLRCHLGRKGDGEEGRKEGRKEGKKGGRKGREEET